MNKKILHFSIVLILIINLFFTISSSLLSVNAAEYYQTLKVKITDVVEPIVGQSPDFEFDYREVNSHKINNLMFEKMFELDLDYEDALDLLFASNPWDFYDDIFEYVERESINPDIMADMDNPNHLPTEQIDEYLPDKTYAAVFTGLYNIVLGYNSESDEVMASSNVASTEGLRKSKSTSTNTTNTKGAAYMESYNVNLTVNGVSTNVIVFDFGRGFNAIALFKPTIPTENLKATVNWKNAEGHIPDSLILKIMNGSTVVKQQTVSKSNAVKDGVWEYTFEDVPSLDNNGNEINYTLAYEEVNEGDLKYFDTTVNGFTIDNTYIAPEVTSKVKMRSIVDRDDNNVKYKIDYSASIKKYSGDANIEIITTLPFAINEEKSDLDGGTYDAKTRSITWTEKIEDIDNKYDFSTTKNVDLYATAVLPYSIEATTVGEIKLANAEDFSDTVDTVDIIESSTGNPKTGDNNLVKYLSLGLMGVAAILIVISIKRKYSTRKSNVQF